MRPSLLAALGAALLSACAALALGPQGGAATGPATLVGRFVWREDLPSFGGFSGLELDAAGLDAFVLSDRTSLMRARLTRDAAGAVTGAEILSEPHGLVGDDGRRMQGKAADSEDLALGPDGALYASFEGVPAVRRLGLGGQRAMLLPASPDWADLPFNASLESVAIDAEGTLYVLPEVPEDGAFRVWRLPPGRRDWTVAFTVPASDGFRMTSADIGPDGRLTLLERGFTGLAFRSRVRRVNLDGTGLETLWTTPVGAFDNLEGLSVWRDDTGTYGGGLRATLISDDNFRFFQQTQIVDLRLPD